MDTTSPGRDREAPRPRTQLPLEQFQAAPGVIDLAWGHPDPDLLPTGLLSAASRRVIEEYGPAALGYGAPQGAGPLLEAVQGRLELIDGRTPRLDEILITAGASSGLDQVATLLCEPGDVVLVESPTYHLAVRILRDHPVSLVPVPSTPSGLDVDGLGRVVASVRRSGGRPRLLYSVTTFANPTGATLPLAERGRPAELLAAEGLTLVEDDTYRELWYDAPPPPSVWALSAGEHVVRLGSFSKTLAPGLRIGYLTASPAVVARFAEGGLLDSGGGNAHFVALVVADLIVAGHYARLVDDLRGAYRARRDALVDALSGLGLTITRPAGGYFAWLDLGRPTGGSMHRAVQDAGTNYEPGTVFHVGAGGSTTARLSFSRYPPETLREGARRLGQALVGTG